MAAIDGTVMIAKRHEIDCPDGTISSGDPRCFAHPQAHAGIAVLAIAIAVGVLIYLVGHVLNRLSGRDRHA